MDNFGISDSIEWRAIRLLAIITALYTAVFMLKMGTPDDLWGWLLGMILFAVLCSPFLLLLKFSQEIKEKPTALRIVFVAMLLNSFLLYETFVIAQTDVGGVLGLIVLPICLLVISAIGIVVAGKWAK